MRHQFATWDQVLTHARAGLPLWYHAPMDLHARRIRIVRVYKNRKIRIDPMSSDADNFTADAGHLDRFRYASDPVPGGLETDPGVDLLPRSGNDDGWHVARATRDGYSSGR